MNKQSLQEVLRREGFRPDCYDLNGGLLPERLTLSKEDSHWCVYYSEHGQESGKQCFATEEEACDYLLAALREDPNAKR
jgi:hypothetical protein